LPTDRDPIASASVVALLGLPGSGKSTLVNSQLTRGGVAAFRAGESLAEAARRGDSSAAQLIQAGAPIPPQRFEAMMRSWLNDLGASEQLLLDGSPRNTEQVDIVDRVFSERQGGSVPVAVVLEIKPSDAAERLHQRARDDGRLDSAPDVIERRLARQQDDLRRTLEYLGQRWPVRRIDACEPVAEVLRAFAALVGAPPHSSSL
jgi:adenylate kinase